MSVNNNLIVYPKLKDEIGAWPLKKNARKEKGERDESCWKMFFVFKKTD
jgi:hypothetical protein